MSEAPSDKTTGDPPVRASAFDVVVYAAARLVLVVVVVGVIVGIARLAGVSDMPLLVAALGGLIVSMPLGMWALSPLRRRATAALAVAGERRRVEREQLRARLRGEQPVAEGPDPD